MPQIEITLDQLDSLVKSLQVEGGGVKYRSIIKCIPILEKSLLNNVFRKPHSDTKKIESIRELALLIAQGSNHKPAQARSGEPYNKEYLERKRRLGEHYPHKYMDYGFWSGIEIFPSAGNSLRMKCEPIYHKGFNYLAHHEERRSVLKRAFLDAWQDIVDTIIKNIAEEAVK